MATIFVCYGQDDLEFSSKQNIIERLDALKVNIRHDLQGASAELPQLQEIIKKGKFTDLTSTLLNLQSYAEIRKQNYPQAYEKILLARKEAISFNNQLETAESLRLEGLVLDLVGEYAKSISSLNESLSILNKVNPELSLKVYRVLVNVYSSLNQYNNLLSTGQRYFLMAQRFKKDVDESIAHRAIGDALVALNQLSEAKYHLALSEELAKKAHYPFIGNTYSSQTNLHLKEGDLEAALNSIIRSAQADKKVGFVFVEGERTLQLAEVYLRQGTPELAITELANKLGSAPIQNDKLLVLRFLDKLTELHQAKGDYKKALEYAMQYREVHQQSYNKRQSQQLALNQVKLNVQQKDQQIFQLTKEQKLIGELNLNQQYLIGLLLLILFMLTIQIYRNIKQKKKLKSFSEEVQNATRAKSDFLARMSHEIRTPINAVIGLTKLTQKTKVNVQQRVNLQQIEDSSYTLLGVINDILDFSKIEAGKLNIDCAPFELDRLINQSIRLQSLKAQEKNIELIQYIEHDVPQHLMGDPLRIQQVLNNLMSNAVKFTDKGVVSVLVTQKYANTQSLLQFSVKDTGIGLSKEQVDKLFLPFSQADESTTRQYGGSGLGLAICKQLIELMGGDIYVESQPLKGSIFTFSLPLKEQVESSINENIIYPQLSKLKILVVDDIDLSRQVVAESLLRINVKPDLAENGHKAIDLIRIAEEKNRPYELVIIDWKMPEIDGIELASIINQQGLRNKPQLLMLSAYNLETLKELGQPLGIKHYLEKPLNSSAILDSLMNMFAATPNLMPDVKKAQKNTNITPDFTGKRLLLVEDNSLNQKVAQGFLADTQIQTVIATNGQHAIDILKENQDFDVILMDIQMPVMDGITASQIIRKELQLIIPIYALTAHAMKADIDKCLALGMNGHISKPIDVNLLYQHLSQLLVQNAAISPSQLKSKPNENFDIEDEINQQKAIQLLRGDEGLYWDLVGDFIQMENQITELVSAITTDNHEVILRNLHCYRTSFAYVGAFELSKVAASLEQKVKVSKSPLDKALALQLRELAAKTFSVTQHLRMLSSKN